MSKITSELLAKIAPGTARAKRDRFIPYYNECMPRYGITDKEQVAAFLTTVCFESDYFRALAEYASGKAYDITVNRRKALELGNTRPGDGPKYKGAGGIETTGKKNYQRLSDRLGIDFVGNPNLLRTEKYFVEAACVFWDDNHFNELADDGEITRIENITNRGSGIKTAKALKDRLKIYANVMAILPDDFDLGADESPITSTAPEEPAGSIVDLPIKSAINPVELPEPEAADSADSAASGDGDMPQPEAFAATDGAVQNAGTIINQPPPPGIFSRAWESVEGVGEKISAIRAQFGGLIPSAPSGLGTKLLTGIKTTTGTAMTGLGAIFGHWEWIVAGVAILAIAAVIWDRSRGRNNPVGAVPPELLKKAE